MFFNTLSTKILVVCLSGLVSSIRLGHRDLNADFLPCYDYIIAGGGVSGLVLANRLSEDPTGKLCCVPTLLTLLTVVK